VNTNVKLSERKVKLLSDMERGEYGLIKTGPFEGLVCYRIIKTGFVVILGVNPSKSCEELNFNDSYLPLGPGDSFTISL
jgi:hypothetical protein